LDLLGQVGDWTYRSRRKLASAGVGLLACLLAWHVVFGANGMVAWEHKRADYRQLQQQIDDLQKQNQQLEERIKALMHQKDEADAAKFKNVVTMYENMKAKDAARIFDRLDLRILVEVSTQINPRKMSEIMAQMTPENAERLTVELANRSNNQPKTQNPDQLPKIEGKPSGS